jgi:hypothetical protein
LPRLSGLPTLSRLSLLGGLSGLAAGLTALPARLPAVTVLSLVVAVPVARTHVSSIILTGNKFSTSGEIGVRLGE